MPRILASLLAALLVVGCSSIPLLSGELRMTADELTQKLARRFPVEKSVAGLLDVTLTRPVVELIAVPCEIFRLEYVQRFIFKNVLGDF